MPSSRRSSSSPTRPPTAIVMEVDLDDLNPLEAVQFVAEKGTLPPEQSLEDVVGAARYSKISLARRFHRRARAGDIAARTLGGGHGAHAVRAHEERLRPGARHRHAGHRARARRRQAHRRARDRERPAQHLRFAQPLRADQVPGRRGRRRAQHARRPRASHLRVAHRRPARRSSANSTRNVRRRRRSTTSC